MRSGWNRPGRRNPNLNLQYQQEQQTLVDHTKDHTKNSNGTLFFVLGRHLQS